MMMMMMMMIHCRNFFIAPLPGKTGSAKLKSGVPLLQTRTTSASISVLKGYASTTPARSVHAALSAP